MINMKDNKNTYIKETTMTFKINEVVIDVIGKRRFDTLTNEPVYDYEPDNALLIESGKKYRETIHFDGQSIIKFRKKHHLTQALFSKILGISRKTLISYEKNMAVPNNQNLKLIQSILEDETLLNKMSNRFTTPLTYKEMETLGTLRIKESVDEYNGYQSVNEHVIIDLIYFFTEHGISQTRLQKALFYADFVNYRETGSSITGLTYRRFPNGPYSEALKKLSEDLLIQNKIERKWDYLLVANQDASLTFIHETQRQFLNKIKQYIQSNNAEVVSKESHQLDVWLKTEDYEKISYDFALEIDEQFFK